MGSQPRDTSMERLAPHTLALVTRALQIEGWHTGSMVIARANGDLIGIVGNRERAIFPRSAIKVIQALVMVEQGAADRFALSDFELSLVCSSHSGAPVHVAAVTRLLGRLGLDRGALACGAHEPLGLAEQRAMIRAAEAANPMHNNCSGKHSGMLATAVHLDEPITDYHMADHPVQQRVRAAMQEITGTDLSRVIPGVDGCSVPNWPVPLENLAVAFARIVTGTAFSPERNRMFQRLVEACWSAPVAMAGAGRFDTKVLERFAGNVYVKAGAEGVYCGGIRSLGIGFALKVDDGAKRAAEMAAGAIIAKFVPEAADLGEAVVLHNAAGLAVGDIQPGTALKSVLSQIRV